MAAGLMYARICGAGAKDDKKMGKWGRRRTKGDSNKREHTHKHSSSKYTVETEGEVHDMQHSPRIMFSVSAYFVWQQQQAAAAASVDNDRTKSCSKTKMK